MFENIILGIIANFMTDFIKKSLGASLINIPPPLGETAPEVYSSHPKEIQARRMHNQERREFVMASLAMLLNLFMLLGIATLLPLLIKSMNGVIDLEQTRISASHSVSTLHLAFTLFTFFVLPSFYIVQKITQYLVTYIHNGWSDVDRQRVVRLFIGCCFVWLPIYAGGLCYWLFPKLSLAQSFGYPIGGVAAMFLYALSRR
ncbi:hypothetical protein ACWWD9_02765 [Methylovorus sp. SPW-M1]